MYQHDHKPVVALAATSAGIAVTHAATKIAEHPVTTFDTLDKWIHLIGGIVGVLAGLASFCWYVYSFIKARRERMKSQEFDDLGSQ